MHRMLRLTRRTSALLTAVLLCVGIQLVGSPALGAAGAGDVRLVSAERAITDSWIVTLEPGTASTEALAGELTRRADGRLVHVYRTALNGFAAEMTQAQARELAADPRVARVEQDAKVTVSGEQTDPPWGLDRIDQRRLPLNYTYTWANGARSVRLYVIDTGLRTSHRDFEGRASIGIDTIDDGQNGIDCQGHGTHVAATAAGTVFGVAKRAQVIGVRVLDCEGSGSLSGVIAGVDWVTENAVKPAVANMSLGGGVDPTLDEAVRNSIASGVTYAVAAGNGDYLGRPEDACDISPARVREAITVGATDDSDRRASFSNYGRCLDLFAPGVDITSAWIDDDTATNTISGTSMASPHTAGAAALYLHTHPTATPAEVRNALVGNATRGRIEDVGPGSPNKLLFTRF
ncbi:S8 family serine peptidase [Streptomyces sp. NPDC008121]|uniref:S8 family peptidase n=1 Tax=Streptomyces sp. NPDC008121 TaxID=3364809 RepID=UPI0036EFFF78